MAKIIRIGKSFEASKTPFVAMVSRGVQVSVSPPLLLSSSSLLPLHMEASQGSNATAGAEGAFQLDVNEQGRNA